jgi:ABC-type transport system involved in cytochrome c biogenesis permease subunit
MSLLPFCQWLADTPGSVALHESFYMYPLVESAHVLTLCLFVGMAATFDLRLLGLAFRGVPVTAIKRRLGPWMIAGFVVMVISGVLLFYAIPVRSYQNIFFRIKVVMLILAGLNAFVFHSNIDRRVAEWDRDLVPPRAARRAGARSLLLWAVIIVCGRMIAYNWFDCDKQPQPPIVNTLTGCVVPPPGAQ